MCAAADPETDRDLDATASVSTLFLTVPLTSFILDLEPLETTGDDDDLEPVADFV
jgi:hypothetical protein